MSKAETKIQEEEQELRDHEVQGLDVDESTIILKAGKEAITIKRAYAKLSDVIKEAMDGDKDVAELRLDVTQKFESKEKDGVKIDAFATESEVTGPTLKAIVRFMELRKGEPYSFEWPHPIVEDLKSIEGLPVDDINFINEIFNVDNMDPIVDVLAAANKLGVKPLVTLCTARLGQFVQKKPAPEVSAGLKRGTKIEKKEERAVKAKLS